MESYIIVFVFFIYIYNFWLWEYMKSFIFYLVRVLYNISILGKYKVFEILDLWFYIYKIIIVVVFIIVKLKYSKKSYLFVYLMNIWFFSYKYFFKIIIILMYV